MSVKSTPQGFHTINPHLYVKEAPVFIEFMKNTFGAKELVRKESPDGMVLRAEIKVGDSKILLAEPWGQFEPTRGCFSIYVKDTDAVYKKGIEAGSISLKEPSDEFYGDRQAGFKDRFGNIWWISTYVEDIHREQLKKIKVFQFSYN